jgi:hypothetical protein
MNLCGSFEIGPQNIDLTGVNGELAKNGAGSFSDMSTTIGGSGYMLFNNRLLIGGEGAGFWQNASGPDAKAKIMGGYGFVDVGVVPVPTRNLLIYPMIGIGGGGAKVRFHSKEYYDFLFGDEVFYECEEPSFGAFAMNFALGTDVRIKLMESRYSDGGLSLSMKAGYIWLPMDTEWEVDGFDIFGSPEATFAGPYVKFGIGIWSSYKDIHGDRD